MTKVLKPVKCILRATSFFIGPKYPPRKFYFDGLGGYNQSKQATQSKMFIVTLYRFYKLYIFSV